jgi:hypothetical protein
MTTPISFWVFQGDFRIGFGSPDDSLGLALGGGGVVSALGGFFL